MSIRRNGLMVFVALVALLFRVAPATAASPRDDAVVSVFGGYYNQTSPCTGEFVQVTGTIRIEVLEQARPDGRELVHLRYSDSMSNDGYERTGSGKAVADAIADSYTFQTTDTWESLDGGGDFVTEAVATVTMSNGTPTGVTLSTTRSRCLDG